MSSEATPLPRRAQEHHSTLPTVPRLPNGEVDTASLRQMIQDGLDSGPPVEDEEVWRVLEEDHRRETGQPLFDE